MVLHTSIAECVVQTHLKFSGTRLGAEDGEKSRVSIPWCWVWESIWWSDAKGVGESIAESKTNETRRVDIDRVDLEGYRNTYKISARD